LFVIYLTWGQQGMEPFNSTSCMNQTWKSQWLKKWIKTKWEWLTWKRLGTKPHYKYEESTRRDREYTVIIEEQAKKKNGNNRVSQQIHGLMESITKRLRNVTKVVFWMHEHSKTELSREYREKENKVVN
jgi:hypothetical protein